MIMGKSEFQKIHDHPDLNNRNILDILSYRAQYQPEKSAYIFLENGEIETANLTYGDLDKKARAIANHIQNLSGERALLVYPSGLEFINAFIGCLYAGVIAVPVNLPRRNQKSSRLISIINDAQASLVLTTSLIISELDKDLDGKILLKHCKLLATDKMEVSSQDFVPKKLNLDMLAFLQYTSGSTGKPKGVMVSHSNIRHNQQLIQQSFGHSEKSIVVGWLPLFHDMGLIGNILQPLFVGFPCILMPPMAFLQKPIRWLRAISKYKGTTSGGPNFAYDLCVKKVKLTEDLLDLNLDSWELAFNGSEPVMATTLEQFSKKFSNYGFKDSAFYPCYGMAESTLFITGGLKQMPPVIEQVEKNELYLNKVFTTISYDKDICLVVGCGKARADVKVIIVNPETLNKCPDKEIGEIWVSSSSIAQGYWNQVKETKEVFQATLKDTNETHFLRTGDLGFVKEGELFVTGRIKDIIIIRGRNYYPQDIELTVGKSHPALEIGLCAAFTVESNREVKLVIVQEVNRSYSKRLVINEVLESIQEAVITNYDLQVFKTLLTKPNTIPRTSSGKIQRYACRDSFLFEKFDDNDLIQEDLLT